MDFRDFETTDRQIDATLDTLNASQCQRLVSTWCQPGVNLVSTWCQRANRMPRRQGTHSENSAVESKASMNEKSLNLHSSGPQRKAVVPCPSMSCHVTGAFRSGFSKIVDSREPLFLKDSLLCSLLHLISKRFGRRLASVAAGSSGLSIYQFLNL